MMRRQLRTAFCAVHAGNAGLLSSGRDLIEEVRQSRTTGRAPDENGRLASSFNAGVLWSLMISTIVSVSNAYFQHSQPNCSGGCTRTFSYSHSKQQQLQSQGRRLQSNVPKC